MKGFITALATFVEEKVADYGMGVIQTVVAGSPIGAAFVAGDQVTDFLSGGMFKGKGLELLQNAQKVFENPAPASRDRRFKMAEWRKANWAQSREDWLSNKWKHDWRSQPRNKIGEWIVGRLSYPALSATKIGKGKQRTSRERRRINRYRRFGRLAARSIKLGN